VISKSGIP